MNRRHWLWLLPLGTVLLVRPGFAAAQYRQARPSHVRLPFNLGDAKQIEELLNQRLHEARLDHLKKLLHDPKAREALMKNFTPEEVERLRKHFQRGEYRIEDPAVKQLLEDFRNSRPEGQSMQAEIDLLKQFAKVRPDVPQEPPSPPGPRNPDAARPSFPPPPPELVRPPAPPRTHRGFTPPQRAEPDFLDQVRRKSSDWLKDHLEDLTESLNGTDSSPDGSAWRRALRRLGLRDLGMKPFNLDLAERTRGLARYLPHVREYLPRDLPLLEKLTPGLHRNWAVNLPHLPESLFSPRLASPPRLGRVRFGEALLWLAVFAALGVALWKSLSWYQARAAAGGGGWRLGPWPVDPAAVAGREELVRAFEYLAFLCLGPAARTCHHRELAAHLGGEEGMDFGRRRQAADHLARIYEQARYAPEDETIPEEELAAARRDLCYLAGVSGA